MSKHTPGPWVVHNESDWSVDTNSENAYSFIGPEGGDPIAIVVVPSAYALDAELDANARLIAAAPELLQALKELLEMTDDPANDADPEESVFTFARSVIAKAEGGDA